MRQCLGYHLRDIATRTTCVTEEKLLDMHNVASKDVLLAAYSKVIVKLSMYRSSLRG
jgi:hypothetical protein